MVGTETGLVIGGNRKGKNAVEKLPTKVGFGEIYFINLHAFYSHFLLFCLVRSTLWSCIRLTKEPNIREEFPNSWRLDCSRVERRLS